MIERQVEVRTPDGTMTTFIFHPEHDGAHPVVLYLQDGFGIRPALKDMASRLATAGYYVMLPNLFYRAGPYREIERGAEGQVNFDLIATVTRSGTISDARALLHLAGDDPAASPGQAGVVGFCMTGGLALTVARELGEEIGAAASVHGARLVTDDVDSPHNGLERVAAEVYLGWADADVYAPPETVPVMTKALDDARVRYTLDFITDAVHGYAPPGSERYDRKASELHWERVHSLLRRNLRPSAPPNGNRQVDS